MPITILADFSHHLQSPCIAAHDAHPLVMNHKRFKPIGA